MRYFKLILPALFVLGLVLYSFAPVKVEKRLVDIPYGTPTPRVSLILYEAGILRNPMSFLLLHSINKKKLEAGEYEFDGFVFPWEVYEKLSKGLKKVYKVTIPEGSDLYDIAKTLEKHLICSSEDFLKYALSEEVAKKYGLKTHSMEGFLFPDTYFFSKNTHPLKVIEVMHQNFLKRTEKLREELSGKAMTLEHWVTIASMVEKETSKPEERALVSAVIHNRIKKGMKLQIDPTVIYALKRKGEWKGKLTLKHLKMEDPYNTYYYYGLPPSPICNPGLASLESALQPAEVDYLYFVADGNGGHNFSKTLREHNRWVREYKSVSR
ncbi:MAG: endolytic transglycosylase MltG [Aquificaceae bacterium]|nr:endolytic transglycosylase MltG [Aquificaceae bacterium]MCX7989449.1 endolytic transglycosylase MltG [Aquificaceae bacterium]MDW8295097.1 endolytic transglycosylase MltG [Aquificaceae bacterium]